MRDTPLPPPIPGLEAFAIGLLGLLEGLGLPGFMVAQDGVLVAMAPGAIPLFRELFQVTAGRVSPRVQQGLKRFDTLVGGANGDTQPTLPMMRLPRRAAPPVVIRVQDVPNPYAAGLKALLLIDERERPPPPRAVLSELFGLSLAEARLVAGLCEGLTLAEIGEREGLRVSTLRTQLLAAFAKTGTRRQTELVAKVNRALGF